MAQLTMESAKILVNDLKSFQTFDHRSIEYRSIEQGIFGEGPQILASDWLKLRTPPRKYHTIICIGTYKSLTSIAFGFRHIAIEFFDNTYTFWHILVSLAELHRKLSPARL